MTQVLSDRQPQRLLFDLHQAVVLRSFGVNRFGFFYNFLKITLADLCYPVIVYAFALLALSLAFMGIRVLSN